MLIEQNASLLPFLIPNRIDEPKIRAHGRDPASH